MHWIMCKSNWTSVASNGRGEIRCDEQSLICGTGGGDKPQPHDSISSGHIASSHHHSSGKPNHLPHTSNGVRDLEGKEKERERYIRAHHFKHVLYQGMLACGHIQLLYVFTRNTVQAIMCVPHATIIQHWEKDTTVSYTKLFSLTQGCIQHNPVWLYPHHALEVVQSLV